MKFHVTFLRVFSLSWNSLSVIYNIHSYFKIPRILKLGQTFNLNFNETFCYLENLEISIHYAQYARPYVRAYVQYLFFFKFDGQK